MRLLFAGGVVRDLRYAPGEAHGSLISPLDDPASFAKVGVDAEAGTVVWPNGLDLAPEVLHGDYRAKNPLAFHDVTPARLPA
jgi:Protein of unknown function (DUF2442)